MSGSNPPTRLRSACDICHKLKRRCTGTTPCKTCSSLGSVCSYSVVRRLGRPRGSKGQPAKQPPIQNERPFVDQDHEMAHGPFDTFDTLDFNKDYLDPISPYELFSNSTQSPNHAPNLFSPTGSEIDFFRDINYPLDTKSSSWRHHNTGTIAPVSLSPDSVQQQEQWQPQHQSHQSRPVHTESDPQFCKLLLRRRQQQQQQQHEQSQAPIQHKPRYGRSISILCCQCIPNLGSLLHDLKQSEDDKTVPVGIDSVLARTYDALTRWSAFASCRSCQSNNGADDDAETLMLAAMIMRRVVAQLKASGLRPEVSTDSNEVGEEDTGLQIHFGKFQIPGSDRNMLLRVLRTITFRKLDAVVNSMQSMLKTKQARRGGADDETLNHVKSIVAKLATTVKGH